jgi:RNA polymerase sigma factor (sigma-70 family)
MQTFHPDFLPHWNTWGRKYAHNVARKLAIDIAEREDLAQEGAMAFSTSIHHARPGSNFRSFAYRAMWRAMIRYTQYFGRCVRVPRGEPFGQIESLDVVLEDGDPPVALIPQHDTACSEPRDIREDVRAHCTRRQWEIMEAKYFQGLSKEAMAKKLKCPPGSQYNIEQQALKKLRKKLGGMSL